MTQAWLKTARRKFHRDLLREILTQSSAGVLSNADKDNQKSKKISKLISEKIGKSKAARVAKKLPGPKLGAEFEKICASYVGDFIEKTKHLRQGKFRVYMKSKISNYDQYSHLEELAKLAKNDLKLATAIGIDYLINPDVVIVREPENDDTINSEGKFVDDSVAKLTGLRQKNRPTPILHASISCKWTMRSDRAQNARSEGLNLVRNRKGRQPHISVITCEPLPSRISSLAMGTGDIDCVYHFALDELQEAVKELKYDEDLLTAMIEGKRLRDISDLPLDLAI